MKHKHSPNFHTNLEEADKAKNNRAATFFWTVVTVTLFMLGFSLTSCNQRGEIKQPPTDFIEIHGKIYKLVKIVPAYDEYPIWIMYPKDSADQIPQVINWVEKHGKINTQNTVVTIE